MRRLFVLILSVFLLAGFDYAPPEFLAQAPPLPAGYDPAKAYTLDLSEALRVAMAQNLGMQLDRTNVVTANLDVDAAKWGMYEPVLSGGYSRSDGADTWSLSATQRLPTGGTISLGGNVTHAPDFRTTTTSAALTFTQPLFRGFSTDLVIPRYAILTAKIASQQAKLDLEVKAAALVQQTESAYWDVVASLYSYGVAVKEQQAAADTVSLVERQLAVGMIPSSDLTGVQNTYARSELTVLNAAQQVESSWDALRTILNLPRDQWDRPILPTDRPHFAAPAGLTDAAAYATAIRNRPELASSRLDIEASELALRKTENDGLPQIDVSLSTGVSGRDESYGGAFANIGIEQPAGWSAGITFTWTPMRKSSKVANQLARIRHQTRIVDREQREQAVWAEVRTAVRNQRAAALEVVAASRSRKLATESLDIENAKYKTGASTNINIATLQNGLASAELTELQALIANERAESQVLLATGQLLAARHIDLKVMR